MTSQNAHRQWTWRPTGIPHAQDDRTVRLLRMGIGAIGILLPAALIAGNALLDSKTIIPSSMSGSYYTSTRNLFVGSLCAIGVFLICYRRSRRQDFCTTFAGLCALAVAFSPTAPPLPGKEPAWVNYLHHVAAGALILTLGLFCWVVFADYDKAKTGPGASVADRIKAWWASAWQILKAGGPKRIYVISGSVVFLAGLLALYTGVWPAAWSTGWPSLYLFEAVAVVAFGAAWFRAGMRTVTRVPPRQAPGAASTTR